MTAKKVFSNYVLIMILFFWFGSIHAQPYINSFTPTSGNIGTTVTITGSGFDATPENNIVFFGATRAAVNSATDVELKVTVPAGATHQPLTVLVNNHVASSSHPFILTLDNPTGIVPGYFADRDEYKTGASPITATVGDLDGDGKPDLVFANSAGSSVSVLRNVTSEAGEIHFDDKIDFTTGPDPFDVTVGDLDGDGKLDLATVNSANATLSVLRNTSTGAGVISFGTKQDFTTGDFPFAVSIADIDGDGKLDLATANLVGSTVSVLRNTSAGAGLIDFASKLDFASEAAPIDIAIADLNGDGKLDLATANWASDSFTLLANNSASAGVISYDLKVAIFVGDTTRSIAIGDLNDDGKPDIALAMPYNQMVSVLSNTNSAPGTFSFSERMELSTGSGPVVTEIADINGDGKPDLATGNDGTNNVSLLENTSIESGVISFAERVNYQTGSKPWGLVLIDLDADGRSDIATANYGEGTSTIWRNTGEQKLLTTSNLPIVVIDTDEISEITKERIGASMKIVFNASGRNDVNGPYNDYDGRISIKGRGESSWELFDKKGYTLETQLANGDNNNVSVLGLPEENDWVLYGPFADKTLMKNAFVYDLGRELGRYAPRTQFCEVMLNGEYRGVYLFTEKIKIDKNRVDIATLKPDEVSGDDLTGGYLMRIDRKQEEYWNADFGWGLSFFNYFAPDPVKMPQVQKDYIKDYITDFEESLENRPLDDTESGYRSYINLPSFIDYFIINELTKNIDSYRLSTYMYKDKDSKGGKLTMGPIWDYNLSCGGINIGNGNWGATSENWVHEEIPAGVPNWWEDFLEDQYYTSCLKERWADLRVRLINDEQFENTINGYAELLDEAKNRNFQVFPLAESVWGNDHIGFTYREELDTLKGFLSERIKWMDTKIASLPSSGECMECFECAPEPLTTLNTQSIEISTPRIYPNPTTGLIKVDVNLANSSELVLELSDLAGRAIKHEVFQLKSGAHSLSVDLSDVLNPGIFLYSISTSEATLVSGKLIVK
ncbi:MAG: CotH kinase family protein [Cyclobacteriaceae bacterium]